jgi:hypothetical protein
MKTFLRSTPAFVVCYLLFMIPTYILPYLGSNSSLVNGASVSLGKGMPPMWWAHLWVLGMLISIAGSRGDLIGKRYLASVATLAALFDLTPLLSMIPFVPTIVHILVISLGITPKKEMPEKPSNDAILFAGLITVIAVAGTVMFISTLKLAQPGTDVVNSQPAKPLAPMHAPPIQPSEQADAPAPMARSTPHAATAVQKPTPRHEFKQPLPQHFEPPPQPVVRHIDLNS